MRKTLFKEAGDRWVEARVEISNGRLSITGAEGAIVPARVARKMAREYWESLFKEDRAELGRMALEYGKRTARTAARFVVQSDGEYHGLDVHREAAGKVYLTESCGQITDTLRDWFPELRPAMPWHLNDLHAECVHQEARGETYQTHPGAECQECGYRLGSAWTKRDLPKEVVALVEGLGG